MKIVLISDLCQDVECKYGARCEAGECVCPTNCEGSGDEAVCASNMMTFPNECELQKAMCLQPTNSAPLSVVFYGDCRERFPVVESSPTSKFIQLRLCNHVLVTPSFVEQAEESSNETDPQPDYVSLQPIHFLCCCTFHLASYLNFAPCLIHFASL